MKKAYSIVLMVLCVFLMIACEPDKPIEKVSVTFDADNGSKPVVVEVEKGKSVEAQEAVKEGYSLVGWMLGDELYDFSKAVESDITLKAKWFKGVIASDLAGLEAALKANENVLFANDIEIPSNKYFNLKYQGTIDGNGKKLIVVGEPFENSSDDAAYCVINKMNGTIKNLDFQTSGFKALVYWGSSSIAFENVDVYGNMNGADTNVGPYLLFPNNSSVLFQNCDNHANIIDRMGGNHYGAAFIGAYMSGSESSIKFVDCNNYGTIQMGQNAAFLIGNPTNIKPSVIKVENCKNYGKIQAFNSVGGISWKSGSFDDTSAMGDYNAEEGRIEKIVNTITAFSVASDGTPSVSITANPHIEYALQYNITYNFKGGSSAGNRNMTISYEIGADGKLPTAIQQIGIEEIDKHEKVIDGVLYVYPYAYEFDAENYEVRNFPSEITYYALDKDEDTGFFFGSQSCKIAK